MLGYLISVSVVTFLIVSASEEILALQANQSQTQNYVAVGRCDFMSGVCAVLEKEHTPRLAGASKIVLLDLKK